MKDLELKEWLGTESQSNTAKMGFIYMGAIFILALVAVKLFA